MYAAAGPGRGRTARAAGSGAGASGAGGERGGRGGGGQGPPGTGTPPRPDADGVLTRLERDWVRHRMRVRRVPSYEVLANELGISRSMVTKVMGGVRAAKPILRKRLLDVLDGGDGEEARLGGGAAAGAPPVPGPAGAPAAGPVRLEGWGRTVGGNVPGSEADAAASLRVPPLPVYRCGTAADPLPNGSDDRPEPVAWQYPPYEVAQRLLPDGFAILVRGGAMAGWRPDPVLDGDVGWVVPASREPPRHRGLAVLRIETEDTRHQGLRVRSYVRGEDGRAEAWAHPEGAEPYRIPASRVDVVGRVVRLERLRSPDG